MMKLFIIIILAMFTVSPLVAQNTVEDVLLEIEKNNTTLQVLRQSAEADKLENRTGIFLDNPEVEFNYLWGSPSVIGNRKDVRATQSFDIPTISGMKSRLADEQNNLVELQYKADRINILLEAKQYLIELVYYNALLNELKLRVDYARIISTGYKEKFDRGDANVLEYNKALLNLSTAEGELSRIEVEKEARLSELQRLNGGIPLSVVTEDYQEDLLPPSFESWYEMAEEVNPVLQYVNQDVKVREKQLAVSKADGLPSFSAGYMREKVVGESYQGLTLGLSIPLWQNKNRVKQARASVQAAEMRRDDTRLQFYSRLQTQYERAYGLQKTAFTLRQSLVNLNNTSLLNKALDAGQISLLEYMVEIGIYYDTINQALEAERDYRLAQAELTSIIL